MVLGHTPSRVCLLLVPELHFHELRHTENTTTAAQGASLKELMERMGHSSPRALIYQHATRERDHKIAAGMGKLFADAKKSSANRTGASSRPTGTRPQAGIVVTTRKLSKNALDRPRNHESG